ncbi:cytochrome-c peroxidase [Deinococcus cellulosilyticus]|uniref:Methylamine utilization protein n=1 Tax=Deinococcus cellulosilyticus (strain DSM 18568 / NBRC 106333 / KACC 11606 / 5516J-15) TaxID=1223518 RepID=A0A511MVI1_DEIC1|nr:cytochrome c peroxidase [Deinococcus cellulosilyticus]GEM44585.1 methylamine utilization protein [Deinococcus cellulosilyticus NBRC 106333 = KACC 11606]
MNRMIPLVLLGVVCISAAPTLLPPVPANNPMTPEKIKLGKKLFYDPILSADGKVSCASCHNPDLAFADHQAVSPGVEGRKGVRNAPTLTNVAFRKSFFFEGGAKSLELQAMGPLTDHNEMASDVDSVVKKLKAHPEYPALFKEVFQAAPTMQHVVEAIASFERTLISNNSPFDRFQRGDLKALTDAQKRGMELFFDQADCFHCHTGSNFTDELPHNTALNVFDEDQGLARLTLKDEDIGKFKTPTLRNIALTAPYMHDGSKATLREAVEHYNKGGESNLNADPLMRPLGLTDDQIDDLVAFMESLTDEDFVRNPEFREAK